MHASPILMAPKEVSSTDYVSLSNLTVHLRRNHVVRLRQYR